MTLASFFPVNCNIQIVYLSLLSVWANWFIFTQGRKEGMAQVHLDADCYEGYPWR